MYACHHAYHPPLITADDCGSTAGNTKALPSSRSGSEGLASRTASQRSLLSGDSESCPELEQTAPTGPLPVTSCFSSSSPSHAPVPSYSAASVIPAELMARVCAPPCDLCAPADSAPATVHEMYDMWLDERIQSRNRQRLAATRVLLAYVQPHTRTLGFQPPAVAEEATVAVVAVAVRRQLAGPSRRSLLSEALVSAYAAAGRPQV